MKEIQSSRVVELTIEDLRKILGVKPEEEINLIRGHGISWDFKTLDGEYDTYNIKQNSLLFNVITNKMEEDIGLKRT